jgi:hypothetical protein
MQILLENHRYRFEGSRPHYIVMPHNTSREGQLRVIEESMNLRALLYDPKDNHVDLAASLNALVPLVEAERENLTRTMNW